MNQNTLQNNQDDSTFTEFSNLRSTVIQPEHSSSIINYNEVNVNSSNNNFPTFYTITNNSDQQSAQPTSNEYIASTSSYAPLPPPPQYAGPQQPTENIPSPLGSLNMTSIHPSNSEILSFDIPGFKIIIIPISSQQQDNAYLNYSSDNQFTQFTQFQP
jgi:hypothetical protein